LLILVPGTKYRQKKSRYRRFRNEYIHSLAEGNSSQTTPSLSLGGDKTERVCRSSIILSKVINLLATVILRRGKEVRLS
jgi:hypothetical protein